MHAAHVHEERTRRTGTVGCGGEVRAAEGVVSCAPCTHVSARVERARRALAVRVCARACTGLSL